MCLYPKLVKNPKYKPNKKNGGHVPPVLDERVKVVPIGCNECMECRKQKARSWQVRLLEDVKVNKNGKFVTLTFSNESYAKIAKEFPKLKGYALDNQIATRAMRLFNERWRKKYKKALRHFMVTELGHQGTEHLHLHGIVWTDEDIESVRSTWGYGWMWPREKKDIKRNYVNERTVNYIIKYITKVDEIHTTYRSVILTSAGIGKNYTESYNSKLNKYKGEKTDETYRTNTGNKMSMPIYWRNKIYTDEEREKLWIQKLDKQERWICGEKISVKHSYEEYYKLLEYYRRINKKQGYGNGEKNWEREQYERERRILKQKEKIRAAELSESPCRRGS